MAAKDKKGRRGNTSPTNVKDLKDLSQQGRAADSLLKNKTLNKALNEMRENAHLHIEQSEPQESEKRENLYRFIKTISAFEQQLKIYFNKGASASKKLEVIINGG